MHAYRTVAHFTRLDTICTHVPRNRALTPKRSPILEYNASPLIRLCLQTCFANEGTPDRIFIVAPLGELLHSGVYFFHCMWRRDVMIFFYYNTNCKALNMWHLLHSNVYCPQFPEVFLISPLSSRCRLHIMLNTWNILAEMFRFGVTWFDLYLKYRVSSSWSSCKTSGW